MNPEFLKRYIRLFLTLIVGITTFLSSSSVEINSSSATESTPLIEDSSKFVNVGILDTIDPWFFVWTFGDSMEFLRSQLPDKKIKSTELTYEELEEAIKNRTIDFFIAPSGFFAKVAEDSGARHVATFHRDTALDPGRAVGSVFVKRKGDNRFNSVKDLEKASLSAASPDSFESWIIAIGELFKEGINLEDIEKRTIFTGYGLPDVVTLVLNGSADVGILKACELEKLLSDGTVKEHELEVIGEKDQKDLRCKVSSDLYPDVVFASLPKAGSDLVRRVSVALFTMPKAGEGSWGFASDFGSVSGLYKALKMGPYSYLKDSTPAAILYRYRYILIGLLGFGLLVLFYIISVQRIVKVRTRELRKAIRKMKTAELDARTSQERVFQMEKAGVVQELSAMFAHEAHQPIASLVNYAGGLNMYLKDNSDPMVHEALKEISNQANRLSQIITRVRSYAKRDSKKFTVVNLREVLFAALEHIEKTKGISRADNNGVLKIVESAVGDALCVGDALEIELVVINLLKNAIAAVKQCKKPEIVVSLSRYEDNWIIAVEDNGPSLSNEEFSRLCEPVGSHKSHGLGLGLSICKVIAESHGGKLLFERKPKAGLKALFFIPMNSQVHA